MGRATLSDKRKAALLALAAGLLAFGVTPGLAQNPPASAPPTPTAADQIADIFSKVGDQLYEECIFELSQEQLDVQAALVQAYMDQGATNAAARQLAAKQIQPPKLSEKCERVRRTPEAASTPWVTTLDAPKKPVVAALPKPEAKPAPVASPAPPPAPAPAPALAPAPSAPPVALAGKKVLPQWDCAPGVDYVTIHLNGFERKLTGGEICNPYEDVVREVPPAVQNFRLGYTIKTGRLFVVSADPQANGQTIAWAISGRDACRNNPDPDCLAARALGPLPPGEYAFAAGKDQRVSWGPRTKRTVAGVYLSKLWNRDRYTPQQTKGILARKNIAIHMRLKGEMSEACIGMEPKGWAYVASLIKEARATGLNVYIDEPHPQIAENPPVVVASTFSLMSLFK